MIVIYRVVDNDDVLLFIFLDEESICFLYQSWCVGGFCVFSEWFCDGEVDCLDNGDEFYCGKCFQGGIVVSFCVKYYVREKNKV